VRFGRGACPDGFLPVFSVDTDEEARKLIVATCSRDADGNYYSHDLAAEQSLERLNYLGEKMERVYRMLKKPAAQPDAKGGRPQTPTVKRAPRERLDRSSRGA